MRCKALIAVLVVTFISINVYADSVAEKQKKSRKMADQSVSTSTCCIGWS